MEPNAEVAYKVDGVYTPTCDDPEIGITWPIAPKDAILSDKDEKLPYSRAFHLLYDLRLYASQGMSASGIATRRRFLITGGAGFIGSTVVIYLIEETPHDICVLDKLTYAGNLDNLKPIDSDPCCEFEKADICNVRAVQRIFAKYRPDIIMHLAAESHVDRSIDGPEAFVQTNVVGAFVLLQSARSYFETLPQEARQRFRFHHILTDEVFGSLGEEGLFCEETAYEPNSPYSASKAASDHFVRAWHHTFNLPTVASNCSNNYGPFHFPEKLIPLTILNAIEMKALPVYGSGAHIRDWLFVEDHARALVEIALNGKVGETYNIGGLNELTNLDVVKRICQFVDELLPQAKGSRASLITFVNDRPGHDQRYAIDASKIKRELGWQPRETFDAGLAKTVRWYIDNEHGGSGSDLAFIEANV